MRYLETRFLQETGFLVGSFNNTFAKIKNTRCRLAGATVQPFSCSVPPNLQENGEGIVQETGFLVTSVGFWPTIYHNRIAIK